MRYILTPSIEVLNLERIYEGVNVYYNYTGEAKCFELDDDPHGMSGWDWQVYKS